MTTTNDKNLFIQNGQLYLAPTLTSDEIGKDSIFRGYTYRLGDKCTASSNSVGWITSLSYWARLNFLSCRAHAVSLLGVELLSTLCNLHVSAPKAKSLSNSGRLRLKLKTQGEIGFGLRFGCYPRVIPFMANGLLAVKLMYVTSNFALVSIFSPRLNHPLP